MPAFEKIEKIINAQGNFTHKKVPVTASKTFAEGQFNRFYILGVCKNACSKGQFHVEIYRAKETNNPRQASQKKVGTNIEIKEVERQLVNVANSRESEFCQPNSGISIRIIQN